MDELKEWINAVKQADFLTIRERVQLKDLLTSLNESEQEIVCHLCNDVYRLGQFANTNIKPEPDKLSEETKKFLDKQTPEKRLELIKDMCVDWDGYRTAAGLGGLINEIWAYATYPCNNKAHVMSLEEIKSNTRETLWMESKIDNTLIQLNKKGIAELFFVTALYNWANFNKIWRCWDKEPTAKQMKEVPWNDD